MLSSLSLFLSSWTAPDSRPVPWASQSALAIQHEYHHKPNILALPQPSQMGYVLWVRGFDADKRPSFLISASKCLFNRFSVLCGKKHILGLNLPSTVPGCHHKLLRPCSDLAPPQDSESAECQSLSTSTLNEHVELNDGFSL